jgi:hypothetical protein
MHASSLPSRKCAWRPEVSTLQGTRRTLGVLQGTLGVPPLPGVELAEQEVRRAAGSEYSQGGSCVCVCACVFGRGGMGGSRGTRRCSCPRRSRAARAAPSRHASPVHSPLQLQQTCTRVGAGPAQMWAGGMTSPGADVGSGELQSRRRGGQRG